MTTPKMLLTAVAAVLTLGMASWASAAECPYRGTLDAQYCDRNRDLIADLPMNESEWVNPDTIIFSYTPVEDPAVYAKVWDEFINHMSKVTGKKVVFFPVQSYAAQYEAMRSGRLHVAGVNTGGNPVAVSCAGFVPFASMSREGKVVGYEMEIIVPAGSAIKTPADLKGKTLAFTSPTSNSGFKAPSALLKSEFGMIADQDFKTTFSGKHDNSILGVANKDYEAASIANSVKARMIKRDVVKDEDLKVLYKSQTFPTTGYGYAYNLTPELQQKIRETFETFEWEGTTLKEEFEKNGEGQFIPITYQEHWDVIRKIDAANDVSYDCK